MSLRRITDANSFTESKKRRQVVEHRLQMYPCHCLDVWVPAVEPQGCGDSPEDYNDAELTLGIHRLLMKE
jgi:hypothetical protein